MQIKAVLFDLGHTLWDVDYRSELAAFEEIRLALAQVMDGDVPSNEALRDALAAVFGRETQAWLNGKLEQKPTEEVYREALISLSVHVDGTVLSQLADRSIAVSLRYSVDPDTRRALSELKERGLQLAAVSNTYQSRSSLEACLSEHGLRAYMDALVISSEVLLAKPHPAIFQRALDELGVAANQSVFVGDIVWADVIGAQSLGMKAVLTHQYRQEDPGEVKPDLIVTRLSEVVAFVDRLRADGT